MSVEKVTLKISAKLAHLVRHETAQSEKLSAVSSDCFVSPLERVTFLFFLAHDKDPVVQKRAVDALRELSDDDLTSILVEIYVHPKLLQTLARLQSDNLLVLTLLSDRSDLEEETVSFVDARIKELTKDDMDPLQESEPVSGVKDLEEQQTADEELTEEDEEFRSKYQLAQVMGTADKIKTALTGDKEWRSIFLKDANKLVSGAVIKNPRITEAEVLNISKSSVQNDEIIRVICANKEWLKNYQIRKALVENHKTPLPNALRFLGTMTEKDLASLSKSKNVSTVISTQARRILLSKQKK